MKKAVLAALMAMALGGCGAGRMLSYGSELSDAVVRMGPAAFSVYVHPKDDTLLIQRRVAQTGSNDGPELIRIVASQFLASVECSASNVAFIGPGSWEASFACPPGVDLRTLVRDQRTALQAGASLHH